MTRKTVIALLALAVLLGAVFAWRAAYALRKSNDNLPALTEIAQMREAEVNALLSGYNIAQLREVWGASAHSEANTEVWQIGAYTLTVNYNNRGVVAACGLKDQTGASAGEGAQNGAP